MKLYCIADEDTVRGFRLAGVSGAAVNSAAEARKALEAAWKNPDCEVVILTEKAAGWAAEEIQACRFGSNRPLIVEIAGPEGSLPGRKRIADLVQAAVGISFGNDG